MKESVKKFLSNVLSPGGSAESRQEEAATLFKNGGGTKTCRIGPSARSMDLLLGPKNFGNLLYPLHITRGVQFPYTPDVTFGTTSEYQDFHFTHSNYPHQQYAKSMPQEIQVSGPFTCQTNEEGQYLLATLRFLRAMSMNEFGAQSRDNGVAGTPPPVLRFNYLGEYMFSNVPVVISSVNYQLPRDVDYVGIRYPDGLGYAGEAASSEVRDLGPTLDAVFNERISGGKGGKGGRYERPVAGGDERIPLSYVPTKMELTVTLKVQHSTRRIRQEFDLTKFKQGGLIKKGFV